MLEMTYYFVFIITSFLFFKEYKKFGYYVFLNIFTYFVVFSSFYFILGSYLLNVFGEPISNSFGQYKPTLLAFFYHFIFIVFFLISNKYIYKNKSCYNFNLNNKVNLNSFVVTINIFVSVYVLVILFLYIGVILAGSGNRGVLSALDSMFINDYKLYFISNLSIISILYLFFSTGTKKYVLLFFPYILYSYLIEDRDFLLKFLLLVIFCFSFSGKKIKLKWLVLPFLFFLSMSYFRGREHVNGFLNDYNILFGEFLYTWVTTTFVTNVNFHLSVSDLFVNSIFKIFPPYFYQILFGSFEQYTSKMYTVNLLHFGLSGSLISEVISYKNYFLEIITPFLIGIYGIFINKTLTSKYFSIKIIFPLSLMFLYSIFRNSFYQYALYPISLMLILGFWVLLVDLFNRK